MSDGVDQPGQPSAPGQPGAGAPTATAADVPADDGIVPRLPRGRGMRLSRPLLMRIAGTVLLLVFLVVAQRPCADSVSTFVTGFGGSGSAAMTLPRPGTVDVPVGSGSAGEGSGSGRDEQDLSQYERLRPDMTEAEIKAVVERARARAAGSNATP